MCKLGKQSGDDNTATEAKAKKSVSSHHGQANTRSTYSSQGNTELGQLYLPANGKVSSQKKSYVPVADSFQCMAKTITIS